MMRRWLALGLSIAGCATLASEAGDIDAVRPSAGAGPFRVVTNEELGSASGAPYVLRQKAPAYRQASALPIATTELGELALYVVAEQAGVHGIYRFAAADARSFAQPDPVTPVIAPSEPWEGTTLSAPEVARVGDEVWLYYGGQGGIGLARSSDGGRSFQKHGPVLEALGGAAWEAGQAPQSPGLLALAGAGFRLFFVANDRIGEASSPDGLSFQRHPDPVLEPSPGADAEPPFDSASVGDPEPMLAESAEGRRITRVYYRGVSSDGTSAIGLAARFGDTGSLSRAPSPVLATTRVPSDPAIVEVGALLLLYFTQKAGTTASQDYPAIALGVAPATITLPPPILPDGSAGF